MTDVAVDRAGVKHDGGAIRPVGGDVAVAGRPVVPPRGADFRLLLPFH